VYQVFVSRRVLAAARHGRLFTLELMNFEGQAYDDEQDCGERGG
jgi:hypothetical protein